MPPLLVPMVAVLLNLSGCTMVSGVDSFDKDGDGALPDSGRSDARDAPAGDAPIDALPDVGSDTSAMDAERDDAHAADARPDSTSSDGAPVVDGDVGNGDSRADSDAADAADSADAVPATDASDADATRDALGDGARTDAPPG